jgi:hypothetical protein
MTDMTFEDTLTLQTLFACVGIFADFPCLFPAS